MHTSTIVDLHVPWHTCGGQTATESALSFTVVGSGSELRTSVLAVSDFTCKAISPTPGVVWRKNREGKQKVMCLRGWRGH